MKVCPHTMLASILMMAAVSQPAARAEGPQTSVEDRVKQAHERLLAGFGLTKAQEKPVREALDHG